MVDYNKSSVQIALDMINKRLNSAFRTKDVTFENVRYLEEGYYNTEATITPVEGSGYQDAATIQYDRVNMASLFRGIAVTVTPAYQYRLSDYLVTVNDRYGLQLTEDDIVDGIIPKMEPPFRVTIKIKESNPAFYGQFDIIVSDNLKSIRKMVDQITFTGIEYPTVDPNKIQGPLYFYGSDWSSLKRYFNMYNAGEKLDKYLLEQLNYYDINVWVDQKVSAEFNLHDATVLYNGPVDNARDYTQRTDYTNAFVFEVDETYCNNIKGYCVMHYNA